MNAVVTRFAPSPTGHLHVGGARTALFNWALARSLGGRFLLRVEDTDRARSSAEAARGILEDLAWLGIEWDEGPTLTLPDGRTLGGDPRGVGPFFQSERRASYDAAIQSLLERDLAYPAFESTERLDALRQKAREQKRNFRYRRSGDFDREAALARAETGEEHVVRFRMPEQRVAVVDQVLGEVSFDGDQLDDFVIRKRDGFPTYHLAVVVDDEAMGVTHVLRGQEHLNNTPRHLALQQALGYREPVYAHLPVIFNADGSKMSKRDKDKAARLAVREGLAADEAGLRARLGDTLETGLLERWLGDERSQLPGVQLAALGEALALELPGIEVEDFRRGGFLPEVLVNFLALLGWSPGEKEPDGRDKERFDPSYLAERFSLERVGRGNARFDRSKLLAFNQDSLAALDDERFLALWEAWCARYAPKASSRLGERVPLFAAAIKPRSSTLADPTAPAGPGAFAFAADDAFSFDEKAVARFLRKGEPSGLEQLAAFRETLAGLERFDPEAIEAAAFGFAEDRGIGLGKIAQPLRVAVTGSSASPGLGDTLAMLGREAVLARIERCLRECATPLG